MTIWLVVKSALIHSRDTSCAFFLTASSPQYVQCIVGLLLRCTQVTSQQQVLKNKRNSVLAHYGTTQVFFGANQRSNQITSSNACPHHARILFVPSDFTKVYWSGFQKFACFYGWLPSSNLVVLPMYPLICPSNSQSIAVNHQVQWPSLTTLLWAIDSPSITMTIIIYST